jgi:hypothetical protein
MALIAAIAIGSVAAPSPADARIDTTVGWEGDGGQANAGYGTQVTTAGDVNGDGYSDILVSAPFFDVSGNNNAGRVWLYLGSATGPGDAPAWTADGASANLQFGESVAPAGDVNGDGYADVIVGTEWYAPTGTREGGAWVYYGSPSGLSPTPGWMTHAGGNLSSYGVVVSTAGDINGDGYDDVLVGAPTWNNGQFPVGKAYVFLGSSSGLSSSPAWTAQGDGFSENFARTVSTAGDVNGDGYDDVLIGSPGYNGNLGAAWVYFGSSNGLAQGPGWMYADGSGAYSNIGVAVGCAGDVNGDGYADILVSTQNAQNPATTFLFEGSAAGPHSGADWSAGQNLWRQPFATGDLNGDGYSDVAFADPNWYNGGIQNVGHVIIYRGGPSGLNTYPSEHVVGEAMNDQFGLSVHPAGDVDGDGFADLIVGAPYHTSTYTQEGRAYLFWGFADDPGTAPSWNGTGSQPFGSFASSVAQGDWNGDGYDDVAVRGTQAGGFGAVYVYSGSLSGLNAAPSWAHGSEPGANAYGYAVANAGDVNGDGYEDLLVGSFGAVYLYYGSAQGLSSSPGWMATGNATFGAAAASAGDVNGDGFADLIVGAQTYQGAGAAYLYLGSTNGPSTTADWSVVSGHANEYFGCAVASCGDVNGDGRSDIVIGARGRTLDQTNEGAAYVFYGSSSMSTTPDVVLQQTSANAAFGYAVASAGDVNGDGFSDVVIGAPSASGGAGSVFVYMGSSSGLNPTAVSQFTGNQATAALGTSVASGDLTGDGYSDLILGAPGENTSDGGAASGVAYVLVGSRFGVYPYPTEIHGPQASDDFGFALAGGGDTNADGFNDIIVGAPTYSEFSQEGAAFSYQGVPAGGSDRPVVQMRSQGSTPLAPLDATNASDRFDLSAKMRTPAGRGRVRLEYQVAGVAASFPGITGLGSWLDSGSPQGGAGSFVSTRATVSGLTGSTAYHWRARLDFHSPFFAPSRWLFLARNGSYETDFRTASPSSGVGGQDAIARALRMEMRPNPWTRDCEVHFDLPASGRVLLTVHDVSGRRIATLADAQMEAGSHVEEWNGRTAAGAEIPAGVYFLNLDSQGRRQVAKVQKVE